jgi:transcriptional regulator with XRE-family HTH domain
MVEGSKEVVASTPEVVNGRNYEEEIASLGTKLRDLRRARKMSLEELSDLTGLSIGILSQIERGKGNPSFVTLMKVADSLDIQLGYFFSENSPSQILVRKSQRRRMRFTSPGLTYELVTPDLDRRLEVVWTSLEPGSRTQEEPFSHEGEECILLISGVLEAHVAEQVFMLEEGDAITFDCTAPHWYYNPGPDVAEVCGAITPPSF